MVGVSEIARFTPGERTLRLVMDVAAALLRAHALMTKNGHWEVIGTRRKQ